MNCVNCGNEVSGKYCPECGQKAGVKRITLKEGWYDFWSRVEGFDLTVHRTIRDLTLRPGKAAKAYISGNRVLYYGPVDYFFLMITVCLLVFSIMGLDYIELMQNRQNLISGNQNLRPNENIMRLISDNIKTFAFLMIPFQAFTARFIVFRKSGYNFPENAVLPFYTMGHLYWATLLLGIIYKTTGHMWFAGSALFSILYLGFAYMTFIDYQPKWKSFLKGVMVYFLSLIFFTLFIGLVITLVILLMAWLDPDSLRYFKPAKGS